MNLPLPLQAGFSGQAGFLTGVFRLKLRAWIALLTIVGVSLNPLMAAEPVPAKPARYVEDQAGVLPGPVQQRLLQRLDAYERETSGQIVVAVYKRLPEAAELSDYASRVFKAWQIGQQGRDNGVLVLVFTEDRKIRIEVGYGLEGAIPDALAKRIIEDDMTPRFRNGDYAGGVEAGVDALIAASKGEYKGTGSTVASKLITPRSRALAVLALIVGVIAGGFGRVLTRSSTTGLGRTSDAVVGGIVGGIGHPVSVLVFGAAGIGAAIVALVVTWSIIVGGSSGREFRNGRRRDWGGFSGGWGGGGSSGWGSGGGGFGGFGGGGGRSGGGGSSGSW